MENHDRSIVRERIKEICREFIKDEIGYLHGDLDTIIVSKLVSVTGLVDEVKNQKTFDCKILCKQPIDDVVIASLDIFSDCITLLLQEFFDDKNIEIKVKNCSENGSYILNFYIRLNRIQKETNDETSSGQI